MAFVDRAGMLAWCMSGIMGFIGMPGMAGVRIGPAPIACATLSFFPFFFGKGIVDSFLIPFKV